MIILSWMPRNVWLDKRETTMKWHKTSLHTSKISYRLRGSSAYLSSKSGKYHIEKFKVSYQIHEMYILFYWAWQFLTRYIVNTWWRKIDIDGWYSPIDMNLVPICMSENNRRNDIAIPASHSRVTSQYRVRIVCSGRQWWNQRMCLFWSGPCGQSIQQYIRNKIMCIVAKSTRKSYSKSTQYIFLLDLHGTRISFETLYLHKTRSSHRGNTGRLIVAK